MAIDTSWMGDFSKVKAKAQTAQKTTTPAKPATKTPAPSPEGSLRYYQDQGLKRDEALTKMKDYKQAQKIAQTLKEYEDAQKAKVNPFNPLDEFQKFLDSKDQTYWDGIEKVAKEKVNPYYDRLRSQLAESFGIDSAQLGLKREQNQQGYDNDIAEIQRMSTYAKDDFARTLGKTDRAFASTIQRATEAYGQRNLLNSGVQAYGNLMGAKDQQADKDGLKAGMDKTLTDLEASRLKAFQSFDLTKRSLDLTEKDALLKKQQNEDKLNRDQATELEVARANADERITDKNLGDISSYTQQRGAIPTGETKATPKTTTTTPKTASLSTVKTLQKTTTTAPKKFAKPLLI